MLIIKSKSALSFASASMIRIRHCLECPRCRIRYLISLAPYENGSYIVSSANRCIEEYVLHCSPCRLSSRWHAAEVLQCQVSNTAYQRGYGTDSDVWCIRPEGRPWTFPNVNASDIWQSTSRRKNQS
jgi:hypothetical protein